MNAKLTPASVTAKSCVPTVHFQVARNFAVTTACDAVCCVREKRCVPACHRYDLLARNYIERLRLGAFSVLLSPEVFSLGNGTLLSHRH